MPVLILGTIILGLALSMLIYFFSNISEEFHYKKITENQKKALQLIYDLARAEIDFQEKCYVDQDNNGKGEFGLFQELSGFFPSRTEKIITNPLVSKEIGKSAQQNSGIAKIDGYCFKLYLPSEEGSLNDKIFPIQSNSKNAKLQEKHFIIYAWPEEYSTTGISIFCVNEFLNVIRAPNSIRKYSGASNAPNILAAFNKIEKSPFGKEFSCFLNFDLNKKCYSFDEENWEIVGH